MSFASNLMISTAAGPTAEFANLGDLLRAAVVKDPAKVAVVQPAQPSDTHITYGDLDRQTTALAQRLLQIAKPGDRVAVHWTNAIEVVELFFACFKAGLIAVPVNVRMKAPEIRYVLEHSKSVLCFSQPELSPLANEAARDVVSIHRVYTSVADFEKNTDVPSGSLPEVNLDHHALILYTSGTTARPKGVTHTHRSLLNSARLMVDVAPGSFNTVLVLTQMMHTSGINCDLLPSIYSAGTAVLVPAFDAALVLNLIERYECSFSMGLPSLVQFLLEEQTRQPRKVSSLKTFVAGGDSVPVAMQERFQALFGITLREGFGMTESLPSIFNPADRIRPGSLGKPVAGVEVRVIADDGSEARRNEKGEIVVHSSANCVGYWDDPASTVETLRGGWLHTGDLGRIDADGYLWFEGRKKEIIIRGGSNISPQEVEEALYSHPAVLEAAVIGMPDGAYGEKVLAFVSLRAGLAAEETELREHARARLADYKVPEAVHFLDVLPKGITGKLQRRVLKEMAKG